MVATCEVIVQARGQVVLPYEVLRKGLNKLVGLFVARIAKGRVLGRLSVLG